MAAGGGGVASDGCWRGRGFYGAWLLEGVGLLVMAAGGGVACSGHGAWLLEGGCWKGWGC